mmetsp:Transcript_6493/g.19731  ORF Transcript_6493/g.19731 Transcript_6493/m.19731 type:complete len:218 (-) Transcript_6493:815-1468(-)
MSCISPLRRLRTSTTAEEYSSGTAISTVSNGSDLTPSMSLMMTSGGPTSSSKPSRRMVSIRTVRWSGPRPETVKLSPTLSSQRSATFRSSSFMSRSRMTRLVSLSPSRPAKGDLLTANDIETVGSSISRTGMGRGSALDTTVSPMVMSETPEKMTISPALASSTFLRPRSSNTKRSLILIGRTSSSGPFMAPNVPPSPARSVPERILPIPSFPLKSS